MVLGLLVGVLFLFALHELDGLEGEDVPGFYAGF